MEEQELANVKDTGAMVAILTALGKVIKDRQSAFRGELQEWLMSQYEETDIDSMALKIGSTRVGKAIIAKPAIGFSASGEFDQYAYDMGEGTRTITIDATGMTDEQVAWFLEAATECDASATVDFKATDLFKKCLEIKGNNVINRETGEMVPGTYIKPAQFRVAGCKPADVGEAMQIAAAEDDPVAGMSVAGLLESA